MGLRDPVSPTIFKKLTFTKTRKIRAYLQEVMSIYADLHNSKNTRPYTSKTLHTLRTTTLQSYLERSNKLI